MEVEIKEGVIYKWTNKLSGKSYIGQTIDEKQRYYRHLTLGAKFGSLIDKVIEKEGKENFVYEVLERITGEREEVIEKLNILEKKYIEDFDTIVPNGYNLKTGGLQGSKYSEETRKKLIAYQSTRPPISEETRRRMSETRKGRVYSEEWRRHISEGQKGKKLSEETRRRISEVQKGHKQKLETIEKRRQSLIGKKHTDEAKRRMSESQKKKWERIKSDPERYEKVKRNISEGHKNIQTIINNDKR